MLFFFFGVTITSFGQILGNGNYGCTALPGNNGNTYPKNANTDVAADGSGGYYATVEDCAVYYVAADSMVDTVSTDGGYTQIDMLESNLYMYNKNTMDIDQVVDNGSGYVITTLISTGDASVKDISIRDDGSVDWVRSDGTFTNSLTGDFTIPYAASDVVFTDGYLGGARATFFVSDQSPDVYRLQHSDNTLTLTLTLSANGKNISYRYDANTLATNPVIALNNGSIVEIWQGNTESQIGTASSASQSIDIDPYNGGTLFDADDMFILPILLQDSALPVEYSKELSVERENGETILNWETAIEVNSDFFAIERRMKEKSTWSEVGRVEAIGSSTFPQSYSMIDETVHLNGQYIYRLKQVDLDGKFEYSRIVDITVDDLNMKIYPTNTQNYVILNVRNAEISYIDILDAQGQIEFSKIFDQIASNDNQFEIDVSHLSSGAKYVRVHTNYAIFNLPFIKL